MHGTDARPPEPWSVARAEQVIARHATTEGGLLPALHDLQDVFGFIPDEAVRLLAQAFNLSRAGVRRPSTRPSIIAEGAVAQRPRQ